MQTGLYFPNIVLNDFAACCSKLKRFIFIEHNGLLRFWNPQSGIIPVHFAHFEGLAHGSFVFIFIDLIFFESLLKLDGKNNRYQLPRFSREGGEFDFIFLDCFVYLKDPWCPPK